MHVLKTHRVSLSTRIINFKMFYALGRMQFELCVCVFVYIMQQFYSKQLIG